jgi:DNA (cytosine-5)-methyltransferase 1
MEWITGRGLVGVSQHEARRHMDADLVRYFYAAAFADRAKHSPNLSHFDEAGLLPNHASAHSDRRPFADRFRVQVWDSPSTTVVSHISKDGHYYIHPDPLQMRSLTLREAARLQTFPDDYFFVGNKTQQYVQVGNAVPPLLANQIAHVVAGIMDRCQSTT